jgi:DNA-binding NarL/FixJ family response regulator
MSAEPAGPVAPVPDSPTAIGVWLIEDNEAYRGAIARALNSIPGLRCAAAFTTAESALRRLAEADPPEVILLDIGLPGMSGLDAIGRFKSLSPATHILILTVCEDTNRVFRAICAGASGYLLKTSTLDQIGQAIRDVMDGGAPLTPQVARAVLQHFARLVSPLDEYRLSPREQEALEWMVKGLTKKEIAARLELSVHTVDTHLRNIYRKLHVHTRTGAVAKALQHREF